MDGNTNASQPSGAPPNNASEQHEDESQGVVDGTSNERQDDEDAPSSRDERPKPTSKMQQ